MDGMWILWLQVALYCVPITGVSGQPQIEQDFGLIKLGGYGLGSDKALFFEEVGHDFGELQVAFGVGVDLVGAQAAVA